MININYRDGRPIFEQVKDGFRGLMLSGALKEGDKMPSVRELAVALTINPNTIQRAYRELEGEGYIVSVPGKGSFVSAEEGGRARQRAELSGRLRAEARALKEAGFSEEEQISIIREVYNND